MAIHFTVGLDEQINKIVDNKQRVIEHLHKRLIERDDVYALWIEGSIAQGYDDEYSDIDVWLSVDDDKIFTIYHCIEAVLAEIAPIDFRYEMKNSGELGHTTYHLEGMSDFLTIDVNTQGISREVELVEGVDDATVIFDKKQVVDFRVYPLRDDNVDEAHKRLDGYYKLIKLSLIKSSKRSKPLEILYYYHLILRYVTKFLRLKHGWQAKTDYDLKHAYRDLPEVETKQLEKFYNVNIQDIGSILPELEAWIKDL